jgi:glycosyltransferase involved in cell wall biosynthesis
MNKSNGGTEIQLNYFKKFVDKDLQSQTIIHSVPSTTEYFLSKKDSKKINIVWTQQSYDYLESLEVVQRYDEVDGVVFVSNWQKSKYAEKLFLSKNEKNIVIKIGIIPIKKHNKPKNVINLIYFSTPYRGLDILLDTFETLNYPNVYLHVFSSMKIYGQDCEDKIYEKLYDRCRKNKKIKYYGSVDHAEILNFLKEVHIMSYPSTFEETCCISALEAMSAECSIVCSNLGALPETSSTYSNMYNFNENKNIHIKIFREKLIESIENYNQKNFTAQKEYVDSNHSWSNKIKYDWEKHIRFLIDLKNNEKVKYNYE